MFFWMYPRKDKGVWSGGEAAGIGRKVSDV